MLKPLTAILFLAAFSVQTFYRLSIVVDYYTNTASFAKNCENKARPMLHCNGHCQLSKKMKQEENKDKQNPERRNDNKDEVISSKSFFACLSEYGYSCSFSYPSYHTPSIQDMPSDFFHPPGA